MNTKSNLLLPTTPFHYDGGSANLNNHSINEQYFFRQVRKSPYNKLNRMGEINTTNNSVIGLLPVLATLKLVA